MNKNYNKTKTNFTSGTLLLCLLCSLWSMGVWGQTYTSGASNWNNVWSQNSGRFDFTNGIGQFSFGSTSEGQVDGRFFTTDGTLNGEPRTVKPGQRIRIRIAGQDGGGRSGIVTNGIIGVSIKSGGGMFDGSGPAGRYDNNSILKIEFVGGQSTARFTDGSGFSTSFMPNFSNFKSGTTYDIEVISDREFNLVIGANRNNIRSFAGSSSVSPAIIHVRNTGANMDGLFTILEVTNLPVNLTANDSESFTVTGVISNNESTNNTVEKNGTGTVILNNQNTYTGLTTINAGTLQLNRTGGTTIPNTNSVTVNGGTLQVSTNQTLANLTLTTGALTIDSGATLTLTGNVTIPNGFTITNNGTLVIEGALTDNRDTKTFGGTVRYAASSGSQSVVGATYNNLELNGNSTKNLSANATINGNLTINVGTLNLGDFTANHSTSGGSISLGAGTTLQIGGTNGFPANYSSSTINATSTVVYNGTTQTVAGTGDGITYGNLELSGSGTKSFASTPNVAGNFVIGGTATVTSPSAFRFSGSSAQNIAGLAYNDIEFSGSGNKTFTSNASVSPESAITFSGTPGTVDFDGASNNLEFVLQSTTAGTARIAEVPSGWTLSGQVRAERFVPARRAWRLMASAVNPPANNTIWHQWQNSGTENGDTGINIFGPNANLSVNGLHPANASSIFEYPTTLPASNWTVVSNTQNAALSVGGFAKGYLLFITNPFTEAPVNISGQGSAATTLRPKGTLRVGNIDVPTSPHPLHTLVGNPYASPINVAAMVSTNTANFGSKIWVFDPALIPNGGYTVYDSGAGGYTPSTSFSNSPTTPIQSGQAFFVRQSSGSPNYQIRETHKSTQTNNVFGRLQTQTTTETTVEQIRLSLFRNVNNEWRMADGAVAAFSPVHSNELDSNDVTKMSKGGENLSFRKESTNLTIEFRNTAVALDTLTLRVTGVANGGEYSLRLHSQDFTNTAVQAYLWDTFTTTLTEIPLNGDTVDYLFQTSAAAPTSAGDRFRIVFQDAPLSVTTPQVVKIHAYPNPVQEGFVYLDLGNASHGNYQVQVIDVLGKTLISTSLMNNGERQRLELASLPSGMYVIQISNEQEKYSTKLIVE